MGNWGPAGFIWVSSLSSCPVWQDATLGARIRRGKRTKTLKSWAVLLCWFITTNSLVHITCSLLIHCSYKTHQAALKITEKNTKSYLTLKQTTLSACCVCKYLFFVWVLLHIYSPFPSSSWDQNKNNLISLAKFFWLFPFNSCSLPGCGPLLTKDWHTDAINTSSGKKFT